MSATDAQGRAFIPGAVPFWPTEDETIKPVNATGYIDVTLYLDNTCRVTTALLPYILLTNPDGTAYANKKVYGYGFTGEMKLCISLCCHGPDLLRPGLTDSFSPTAPNSSASYATRTQALVCGRLPGQLPRTACTAGNCSAGVGDLYRNATAMGDHRLNLVSRSEAAPRAGLLGSATLPPWAFLASKYHRSACLAQPLDDVLVRPDDGMWV